MRYEPIAIVGLGLRFPGAESPRQLWNLLSEEIDATAEIPSSRWELSTLHDPSPDRPGKIRNRRAGLLEGVENADPLAFRLPKRELRQMDPQHRVLFESAWYALEDAGIPFDALRGSRTGVFVGLNFNDFQRMLARDWTALDGYALLGTTPSFAANRISYAFDLRGPSTCTSVGCASSTSAIHEACRSLTLGEVDLALAGGVDLMLSPESSIMLSQAGVLSARGQCRTLDAEADGYIRGEGAGVVVLKPLSRVDASDRVYAVIRGSAVNHNGRNEWIMASSVSAQAEVIRHACERGGVEAASLDYVELHGSSFLKGDAAEAVAIGEVLGKARPFPCRLGAVSNNLGYMGAAAGIAQFIKVSLSLYHRAFLPTIHVETPNPQIAFEELGLSIQSKQEPWPERGTGEPRRAGVVSTSLGGSNAFVVLEAAPEARLPQASSTRSSGHLLVFSALSPEALRAQALQLRDFLAGPVTQETRLEDVCFTAAFKRQHHRHRAAVIAGGREGLVKLLGECARSAGPLLLAEEGQPPGQIEAGKAYVEGGTPSWEALFAADGRCVSLPGYPFQRQRLWPEWLSAGEVCRAPTDSRPEVATAPPPQANEAREIREAPAGQREARLVAFLRVQVAEVLEADPAGLDTRGRTFFELGMNSIGVTSLKERISRGLGLELSSTVFFEHPRVELLAKWLSGRWEARTEPGPREERPGDTPSQEDRELAERIAGLSEDQTRELIARKLAEFSIEVE
ncbi:beta-ketoacyl synthase N-terminal-like domain-containing protein [Stigmatella sp. ncwal1]|uniref:Beta-ketoacyl synthase N-terminal-like domain-containing protein n=1 Tax=Stigmatella ashevillensis TaxID=2995309 RepID=A0ABT5D3C5_9BACT|nr:beta-ketoacyl synthase N-terminal-like domain-containing protein [Stigmatella ashevillena]MDC0708177.1 beta-ketoacyl synthase N-terminal-like domain-containing protein [Stigmatella ashevillena]